MLRRLATSSAVVVVLALVACSDDETATDTTSVSDPSRTELTADASDPTAVGDDEATTSAPEGTLVGTTASSTTVATTPPTPSTSTTTTVTVPAEAVGFCALMEQLASENVGAELFASADWAELQLRLIDLYQKSGPIYEQAIALAPPDVGGWLTTLQAYNEQSAPALSQATSLEEYGMLVGEIPPEVIAAGQALGDYVVGTCGIQLSPG